MPDLCFLSNGGRNGVKYFAIENHNAPKHINNIRMSSFFSKGPRLFNLLPQELRMPARPNSPDESKKLLERFKRWLDKWLELIPDQPTTDNTSGRRGADSNTLIDQMKTNSKEVSRRWLPLKKQLEKEDKEGQSMKNKGKGSKDTTTPSTTSHTTAIESSRRSRPAPTTSNHSAVPTKRRRKNNNYGKLTEESLRRLQSRGTENDRR